MSTLPLVHVDTYSEELRGENGFLGDRANRKAFHTILDDWRDRIHAIVEEDPMGPGARSKLTKKRLDRTLTEGSTLAAGVLHTAIEEFAQELAEVTIRFLELESWQHTERIVVGGGLRGSRVGEVMIGRASILVKQAGHRVRMDPIRHDPDEAALIGATQLLPTSAFRGKDAMLAVDIGGSNIRAGVVDLAFDEDPDLTSCRVVALDRWRYADEKRRPTREMAVERLIRMLEQLKQGAEADGRALVSTIGVACPGSIMPDGFIRGGAQNLPGNWTSPKFNLAERLQRAIPKLGKQATRVLLHNDAVVQGLGEAPFMRDIPHWAILTIGTGLGNARFTNRATKRGARASEGTTRRRQAA
ncbi:MAG: ROK family protein [Polyangiaceae bacterium]|nr:ROK family protein [Polyangiaceae bacterium]